MNKDQLDKILDLARDYFISDISIVECYNKYAEANGLNKINIDKERADKCDASKTPEDAPESPRGEKCNSVPEKDPRPVDVKLKPSKIVYDNITTDHTDMSYFAEGQMSIGDVLFSNGDNIAYNYVNINLSSIPIGISMNNVCDYYVNRNFDSVPNHSKIKILIKGEIIIHLDPELTIPKGQKLYFDDLSGKVGWRKTPIKYGKALSHQCIDGFIRVKVDFT